jgi:type IX secretion system PorP/SprF family membrane protein
MKAQPLASSHEHRAFDHVTKLVARGAWLVAAFVLLAMRGDAQDVHFSQFYNSPLTLNPALSGAIQGDQRFALIHRSQWQSMGAPFRTFSFSYDAPLFRGKMSGRYLGIGGNGYSDKAGNTGFGDTQANLSVAYGLKSTNDAVLAFGLQGGYGQRSATLEGMRWDAQYDGSGYDPSRSTNESMSSSSTGFVDLSAGVIWQKWNNNEIQWTIGAGVFHMNEPSVGLFGSTNDRLFRRYTVHGATRITTKKWVILPKFYASQQGGSREIVAGGLLHRRIGIDSRYTTDKTSSSFYLGVFYRYGDAIIPSMLIEYKRMLVIGVSYDINISALRAATGMRGGMELTLQYVGIFKDKRKRLPHAAVQ